MTVAEDGAQLSAFLTVLEATAGAYADAFAAFLVFVAFWLQSLRCSR